MTHSNYMDVEDLEVYKKLCRLHIGYTFVEWIRENIEAENTGTRTPLAVS